MEIDSDVIEEIFTKIGRNLKKPATLCLIGSAPGIASGQTERQTPDIDVWMKESSFDVAELKEACIQAGILFNPRKEVFPGKNYPKIIRPVIVHLPETSELEEIGRYGNLTVVMPPPEHLIAAKLVRGTEVDVEDAVWWMCQRNLAAGNIKNAIEQLPNEYDREVAMENFMVVNLISNNRFRP